jgi:hypothetical protein
VNTETLRAESRGASRNSSTTVPVSDAAVAVKEEKERELELSPTMAETLPWVECKCIDAS